MRLPLAPAALAMLTALAAPALAAPATSSDYSAALDIFLAGQQDLTKYNEAYAETVTRGLDGRWTILLAFPVGDAFRELLARTCERLPVTIRTTPGHGFVITKANAKANSSFDTVFTPMGGSMFGHYTEPTGILGYLGIKEGVGTPSMRTNILRTNNGIATVNRLGDGILVIQTNYGLPNLYGRCE
jgi:hypothetical protein